MLWLLAEVCWDVPGLSYTRFLSTALLDLPLVLLLPLLLSSEAQCGAGLALLLSCILCLGERGGRRNRKKRRRREGMRGKRRSILTAT